jgi:hypothetical protein
VVTTTRGTYRDAEPIRFPVGSGDRVVVSITTGANLLLSVYVEEGSTVRIPDWEALSPAPLGDGEERAGGAARP